eukprot:TRINITY_DN4034_c0_g1_i1.p1 TRINITY_DN4034_c0_g1~~TRINITY_DN4034_c0_g1_i1.p1  ORF type:complete len:691 (+),score=138.33 TRINITY_DN4034_c0_g1_i1:296-2368(+)
MNPPPAIPPREVSPPCGRSAGAGDASLSPVPITRPRGRPTPPPRQPSHDCLILGDRMRSSSSPDPTTSPRSYPAGVSSPLRSSSAGSSTNMAVADRDISPRSRSGSNSPRGIPPPRDPGRKGSISPRGPAVPSISPNNGHGLGLSLPTTSPSPLSSPVTSPMVSPRPPRPISRAPTPSPFMKVHSNRSGGSRAHTAPPAIGDAETTSPGVSPRGGAHGGSTPPTGALRPSAMPSPANSPLTSRANAPRTYSLNPMSNGDSTSGEAMRSVCLVELFTTEADFIDDLRILIDLFLLPLRKLKVLSEADIALVFSNAETIVGVNNSLFDGLKERIPDPENPSPDTCIGDLFVQMSAFFKMYTMFCSNYATSLATVERLTKANKEFDTFLNEVSADQRLRGMNFFAFLIKPIQRVCKYPLLLRDLLKHTPESHPDHENCKLALQKLNEVVAQVNEGQRVAEGMEKILEIARTVEGVKELTQPQRRYIRDGDLISVPKEKVHIFLFTDCVLLTSRKGKDRFRLKKQIMMEDLRVINLSDTKAYTNAFEMEYHEMKEKDKGKELSDLSDKEREKRKKMLTIQATTLNEKQDWVDAIQTHLKEFKKKKIMQYARTSSSKNLKSQLTPGSVSGDFGRPSSVVAGTPSSPSLSPNITKRSDGAVPSPRVKHEGKFRSGSMIKGGSTPKRSPSMGKRSIS